MKISLREEWCKGCQLCVSACNRNLISLAEYINSSGYHPARLDQPERCNGCGLCALMCPDLVIEVLEVAE